jgi:hypothetical protein
MRSANSRMVGRGAVGLVVWGLVGCGEPATEPSAEGPSSNAPVGEAQEALLGFGPNATVIASGIPGANAVLQVAPFRPGSPNRDNPNFVPFTAPGAVLDPNRVLVASASNFGAPLGRPGDAPGTVLSIDPNASGLVIPPDFASGGGQASTLGGAVQVYSAQSPGFLNGVNNPGAVTAGLPSVSMPVGLSSNNGNGRPWVANAPNGANADGTISVLDANGIPLAGAPSPVAGGVFAGDLTNRTPTSIGLTRAALATSLLTRSTDNSGRAVFVAALADGSLAQVHVQKGVDQLAPPGTFTPPSAVDAATLGSNNKHVFGRVGLIFNWAPQRTVFVADPANDRIVALDLSDDGVVFVAAPPRYLNSWAFDNPIDIAPAVTETAHGNFASQTVMAAAADLYVLNRGNNTIARVRQNGDLLAIRPVVPNRNLPGFRVAGLAVSTDGQTLYVTATGQGGKGYLLKMAGFGESFITQRLVRDAQLGGAVSIEAIGASIFSNNLGVFDFVGPLFNDRACVNCHAAPFPGGMGTVPTTVVRVGRDDGTGFDDLSGRGGPVSRARSINEFGFHCNLPTGVPPEANLVSPRSAQTLIGTGIVDSIQDKDLVAVQNAQPAEIRGRFNRTPDGRIGRFGWKADTASLVEFMGDAFRTEQGLTNAVAPNDLVQGCGSNLLRPEVDSLPVHAVTTFMNTLDPPAPSAACLASPGAALFSNLGCAGCHTPSIVSLGRARNIYSDLQLHDMGGELADGIEQGLATGSEFRTQPLWRVSQRPFLLHDGRATTYDQAINAHGGQAAEAQSGYQLLSPADQQLLFDFLDCI